MNVPFLRGLALVSLMGSVGCDSAVSHYGEEMGGTSGTAGKGGSAGTTGGSAGRGGANTGGILGGGTGGSVGEAGAGATGGEIVIGEHGCTPGRMTTMGELRGQYESTKPTVDGKEYFLQVNEWNSMATQVMAYGGEYFFKMTQQDGMAATNGSPTGYPSMFIGANAGNVTMGSNLPKQVSALTSVPTTWAWNDNGLMADTTTNIWNSTYDVWFSTNAAGEPNGFGPSGGYLMVWLYDPPSAQPIGRPMAMGVSVDGVDGTWDVWIGQNGSRPCISYVRTEPSLVLSTDLNFFIKDAVANRPNTISNDWYLSNVFIGFEIWSGGAGLETTSFCVTVN
ncbi:MAG TPA: hypothetical protein VF103_06165 [Polyangiaceae bacterium]